MVLQELEKTIERIRQSGTDVHFLPTLLKGIAYWNGRFSSIVVNTNLSYEETRDVLIHEDCHLVSNSLYKYRSPVKQKEFCEARASNMAVRQIIPLNKLINFLEAYPRSDYESLANHFCTTIQTVKKAINVYQDDEDYLKWWEDYKERYENY